MRQIELSKSIDLIHNCQCSGVLINIDELMSQNPAFGMLMHITHRKFFTIMGRTQVMRLDASYQFLLLAPWIHHLDTREIEMPWDGFSGQQNHKFSTKMVSSRVSVKSVHPILYITCYRGMQCMFMDQNIICRTRVDWSQDYRMHLQFLWSSQIFFEAEALWLPNLWNWLSYTWECNKPCAIHSSFLGAEFFSFVNCKKGRLNTLCHRIAMYKGNLEVGSVKILNLQTVELRQPSVRILLA